MVHGIGPQAAIRNRTRNCPPVVHGTVPRNRPPVVHGTMPRNRSTEPVQDPLAMVLCEEREDRIDLPCPRHADSPPPQHLVGAEVWASIRPEVRLSHTSHQALLPKGQKNMLQHRDVEEKCLLKNTGDVCHIQRSSFASLRSLLAPFSSLFSGLPSAKNRNTLFRARSLNGVGKAGKRKMKLGFCTGGEPVENRCGNYKI